MLKVSPSHFFSSLPFILAASNIVSKINSLQDLANQDEIDYGIYYGGSTYKFFRNATIPLYRKMFETMKRKKSFATSSTEAVERVRRGGYAYMTDGPILSYKNKRQPCDTALLENLLMAKGYGIALQLNSEWTNLLSVSILQVSTCTRGIYPKLYGETGPIVWGLRFGLIQDIQEFLRKNKCQKLFICVIRGHISDSCPSLALVLKFQP